MEAPKIRPRQTSTTLSRPWAIERNPLEGICALGIFSAASVCGMPLPADCGAQRWEAQRIAGRPWGSMIQTSQGCAPKMSWFRCSETSASLAKSMDTVATSAAPVR
ncbi:MAG: hypothetical protein MO853_02495 [Candidatus Protistobacter heckmanni]|nr:hypothetical protein [Candidatus Protistobacter heckmanni]